MRNTRKTDIDALPYRPCVGIALFNPEGLVFVGHRIKSDENVSWQMPQGGIDDGESPREAALRELHEEVGTDKAVILGESRDWLTYELPTAILGRALRGRYRGQRQKWFAMRFTGTDADIDVRTHHPEFDRWKWVPLADVVDLIIAFKRDVYIQVAREFAPYAVPHRDHS